MSRSTRKARVVASRVALAAALAGLFGGVFAAAPAVAAPEHTAVLQVTTSVKRAALAPGDTLSYTIAVECLSEDCVDARVVDALPPEFDALTLVPSVVVTPPPGGTSTSAWTGRTLTVGFSHAGGSGIAAGEGYSIQIDLAVPASLSPDWEWNGVAVANAATASASNAASVTSSATATITVPYLVSTTAGATWSPPSTQFKVGEHSTLTLTTRNTSNARAETLTLLAPVDPSATGNLFDAVDLASLGTVVFPAGADRVHVDARVAGTWIDGAPGSSATLPAGVAPASVTGLRIAFTSSAGAQLEPNGSAGSVALVVGQRAATRVAATPLVTGTVVSANVRGSVAVAGQGSRHANAAATLTIGGLTSVVTGSTVFSAPRIPAGGATASTITGANASNGNLDSLTVEQPPGSLFTQDVTFGGFRTAGAAWPSGATEATLTWFTTGGPGDPAPVELSAGAGLPATPSLAAMQRITGFAVEFRGAIPVGATAAVPFLVEVTADAVPANPGEAIFTQTSRIRGSNDAGAAPPVAPAATLTVLHPRVDLVLGKSISPTEAVPAGGRSIVQLDARTSSDSGYVAPTRIVIDDVMSGDPHDYWRGFDVVAIAPTQVPAGATLLVEGTTDGVTWVRIQQIDASTTAVLHHGNIPGGSALIGVRFTFTDPAGFAQGTRVRPNISFVARTHVRGTATPTATPGVPVSYLNSATVEALGDVLLDGGVRVGATTSTSATAIIKAVPGGASSLLLLDKTWTDATGTVSSQSGQLRTARIAWGSEVTGYGTATITDPADPSAAVASTVFQALDLARIERIDDAADPLIRFDQVVDVELYSDAADEWVSIFASVCASAADCRGRMPAYTLTAPQRADTLGVRVTIAEWPEGRATHPLAPPVGSGVASGPEPRRLDVTFQVRNRVRDASVLAPGTPPWVTEDLVLNATDRGLLDNTVLLELDDDSVDDSATIAIIDPVPAVGLAVTHQARSAGGTVLSAPVSVPVLGDVVSGSYPTVRFGMTATNTSAARAWYLRVTGQMPCTTTTVTECVHASSGGTGGWSVDPYAGKVWDPATSPFEHLTIRSLEYTLSSGSGIDVGASTVTLWYAGGTSATLSLAAAAALTDVQLQDVVGASALFAGSSADGGTIASGATATLTFQTRLRQHLRSDPAQRVGPATLTHSAFAQAWDGVLDDAAAYSSRSQSLALVDASLAVVVAKSATPNATVLEANRTADKTVTLTANQGTSTASTREVVIEDTDEAFWNAFELRSLGTVTLPAGADRARVDVRLDGSSTWTHGTSVSSNPRLPGGITNSAVTGVRVVYSKADGSLFSVTSPAASWSASVPVTVRLRTAFRDGAPIPFPSTITTAATGTADHAVLGTSTASASRAFALDPGTFRVDVEKRTPVKATPSGETVEFSLIVRNTGTGFLDNPVVIDQLPIDAALIAGGPLLFDPMNEVTSSTSAGGILPVAALRTDYDEALRRLTFTWPAGARLAPGETVTIVVPLQVAPGLPATYGDIVNRMTFRSDRTLAACTNTSGNGEGVQQVGATGCATSNDVTTISASAISSFKGVKGDVDASGVSTTGAVNTTRPDAACIPDAEGFYRNPCAASSRIGATDLWKLRFTNGGNVPATAATVVDVLPRAGDRYLGTGAARGSTYRPVFAGDVTLHTDALSAGTTIAWQVTTSATPCPDFAADPTCATATWVDGPAFPVSEYASVTGIRVQYAFPGGVLAPAATLAVGYATVNLPATAENPGLAPATAPLGTQRAWNSFGVSARFGSGYADRRVEPVRAGVQLASGPVEVVKAITGTAAAYAPTAVTAELSCVVGPDDTPLAFSPSRVLTLAAANATPYTARFDGIPLGARCDIVETTGGASSVTYAPAGDAGARLTVAASAESSAPVPAAQVATITNTYGTTDLTIAKAVSTTATVGEFGPFEFTLECTVDTGAETLTVPLAADDAAFTLDDGGSHVVRELPVTARCDLREYDADRATTITVQVGTAPPVTVVEDAPATIVLGPAAAYTATVTNTYASGRLSVTKEVTGATRYGDGEFEVAVACLYDGQTLFENTFTLLDGDTETLVPRFPVGTICEIVETSAGGATAPAGARKVTIAAGTTGTVLTNRFDVGTLRIDKTTTGAAARYGAGPFLAQVTCTWDRPGDADLDIPLPDSGVVELDAGNGYSASVTGLIAGADCSVAELTRGGATHTSVSAPSPRYIPANGESVVSVENHFATGSLRIDKVRTIAPGAEAFADGPFEVEVECSADIDGTWTQLDLLGDETQVLDGAGGYTATIAGILQGARCTVVETDAGHAVARVSSADIGTPVTVPAEASGPAVATVTNTFRTGRLEVDKTVAESLVQGGDIVHYEIAVANAGTVDAGGITVTDVIDPDLGVDTSSITGAGWTCAVTGQGADGFGGDLECAFSSPLGVGGSAPAIAYAATVRPEIAQDFLVNTALVASTTAYVSGDSDTVTTPVKWLDVTASTSCVQDAPWLDYRVEARHVDVSGRTMQVNWLDASGAVIHTDEVRIAIDGVVSGRLLFPGAAVDGDGDGVAWPGWRPARPGEIPDWENLVLDPTLPSHGVRSGASVEFVINPEATVAIVYPPPTAACAEAPGDVASDLWLAKTASSTRLAPGDVFRYTLEIGNKGRGGVAGLVLVDELPDVLRLLSVTPAAAVTPDDPDWVECVVADVLPDGYGGSVTCELDRELGYGQRTPDIVLEVQLSPNAPAGAVVNTAKVTAWELPTLVARGGPPGAGLTTLSLQASALAMVVTSLAATGPAPLLVWQVSVALIVLGGVLARSRRAAPRHRHARSAP